MLKLGFANGGMAWGQGASELRRATREELMERCGNRIAAARSSMGPVCACAPIEGLEPIMGRVLRLLARWTKQFDEIVEVLRLAGLDI